MTIAKLNEISINYKLHRHADNYETIILISGFGCDHKIWSFVIPILANKFNVIAFDNRGSGFTTDNGHAFTIGTMANDIRELLIYLKINKVHVIGHSMGGLIAQNFAINHPEFTNKLVIVNSASYAHKTLEYALTNQNNIWAQQVLAPTQLVKLILPWLFSNCFLQHDVYVNAFINAAIHDPNPQSVVDHKRQLDALINADLRGEIANISCPTLIVSSAEDLLTPPFINQEIANEIKNSKIVTIPGGHICQIEQPEALAQEILQFLV